MDSRMMPHEEIERYVLGKMNQAEIVSFEKEIKLDPALSSEVDFQRSVIKGIGEARKAALKSRLADIPVSTSWLSSALNSGWSKIAAGVVVASTASVLIYTSGTSQDEMVDFEPIAIEAPNQNSILEISIPAKTDEEEIPKPINDNEQIIAQPEDNMAVEDAANIVIAEEEEIFALEVNIPDMDFEEELDEQGVVEEELVNATVTDIPLAIDVINTLDKRQYRYFEGELTLKGDYQSVQYDLLELNSAEGKQYFIEIAGDYYSLPQTEQFKPLKLIVNKRLISRLDSITSNQ